MLVLILLKNNEYQRSNKTVKILNLADKTSTRWTINKRRGSNSVRVFGRGRGNTYGKGQGCGFNPTKRFKKNVKL